MSEQQFFIRQGEKIQGPFPVERIRGWIAAGRVRPEMELSDDGTNFWRGDQIAGLFDAVTPVPVAPARTLSTKRPDRDDDPTPRRTRSAPPPPASIVVIGCRLLAVIAMVVALAVGQWTHVSQPLANAAAIGGDTHVSFGLTELSIGVSQGNVMTILQTSDYAAADLKAANASARGTTKTLGLGIVALILVSMLLVVSSFGEMFGKPGLSRLATIALLTSIATSILGWVFMKSGLVNDAVGFLRVFSLSERPVAASGGFSFYLTILATLILAIAWTRSRVVAMDAARRARRAPPPKRRRR